MPLSNTSPNNNDMQDALEAYRTFRSARSLCFWIILVSLLILQTIFWVVNRGKIDAILNFDQDQSRSVLVHHTNHPSNFFALQTADESPEPDSDNNQPSDAKRKLEMAKTINALIRFSLRLFNTLICFAALLYCLSLLIGMKLALVGHLGGLAESGKAFFLSLVVLVLILPWQPLFAGETPGTLFSYQELTHRYVESTTYMTLLSLDAIAFYVRFAGFWGLTLLLLLAAQRRSCRAVRQITRRCQEKISHPSVPAANTTPFSQPKNNSISLE